MVLKWLSVVGFILLIAAMGVAWDSTKTEPADEIAALKIRRDWFAESLGVSKIHCDFMGSSLRCSFLNAAGSVQSVDFLSDGHVLGGEL